MDPMTGRAIRAALALVLAAATAVWAAPGRIPRAQLDPLARNRLEQRLARARTVPDHLAVARAYAAAGLPQTAKQVVDRAAHHARTEADWRAVAGAYRELGYEGSAALAERRAREAPPAAPVPAPRRPGRP